MLHGACKPADRRQRQQRRQEQVQLHPIAAAVRISQYLHHGETTKKASVQHLQIDQATWVMCVLAVWKQWWGVGEQKTGKHAHQRQHHVRYTHG
jgi:hypothetical protein